MPGVPVTAGNPIAELMTDHASPARSRAAALDRLGDTVFDLLVVGGGITGAGVARDAALRGLSVALVEQHDFASGTSSRSSRLVHGGVRYLEHGQLRLVFESSRERRTLLRIAPHLVRPLAFTWPVYRGARIARWQLAAALTLYDALALFRNVARHQRLDRARQLESEPLLRAAELRGGARYWDAATDDVRLTLANVRSARAAGAVAVNHARVESLLIEDGAVIGARVVDTLCGRVRDVRARVVVNAAGPWSDRVERLANAAAAAGVRGSKGVHVLVPRGRVGNIGALTLLAPQDGRVMFVLPMGDFAMIGTTDTFSDVDPAEVRASERDVAYLITATNHYFPAAVLTRSDVVSAWAGLRPLVAGGTGGDADSASREHAIERSAPGLVRVTGGKLTTYRAMASEVVDFIQRAQGLRPSRSRTADLPLHGGEAFDLAAETRAACDAVGEERVARRLVQAHGSEWRAVWAMVDTDPSLRERIDSARPYLLAELRYGVEQELACTLGDLFIRRTPLAFETRDHGCAAARLVAPLVAEWLGWDLSATAAALESYDAEVAQMFGVEAGPAAAG